MRVLIFEHWIKFSALAMLSLLASASANAQSPVIVQPGAPGQATRQLPADTRPSLPPTGKKDIEFMQGMIMHHAQAVEMTDMIAERSDNPDLKLLGGRISKSQTDEMEFMTRWLVARGKSTEMKMDGGNEHSGHHGSHNAAPTHQMPGMLSPEQMKALKAAKGNEFLVLFLKGMIQHHEGALTMVKDLHDTAGTAQDAELFNFASDVDSGQRAEIKSMQNLLARINVEKKP